MYSIVEVFLKSFKAGIYRINIYGVFPARTEISFHLAGLEKFNFSFSRVFFKINKTFIFAGGLGTRLSFYGV